MQDSLFPEPDDEAPKRSAPEARVRSRSVVPAPVDPALAKLALRLPKNLRLGTSSWSFPGWIGTVWDGAYADAKLSKHGLRAYAQHPLFRTVSLDRSFYRPLTVPQFRAYAAQVPDDFRFVVKAPSLVTDALLRDESGRGQRANAAFLDAALALSSFVEPAMEGLGHKLGALVFQISPLPGALLDAMSETVERLHALLGAMPPLSEVARDAVIGVEVRDAGWLTPAFTAALLGTGATYCLGLHPRMPPIGDQLPILRALWPGPLLCRWNLNPRHGVFGYAPARAQYAPFDRIVDADPATREVLSRVIAGTARAGQPVYVTVNNKAEGSAPLSVAALAQAVAELRPMPPPG